MKKTNIKKSIFPFIAGIMGGCNQHSLQQMNPSSDNGNHSGTSIEHQAKGIQTSENKGAIKNFLGYVTLAPGFTELNNSLDNFKSNLIKTLQDKYNIKVDPKSILSPSKDGLASSLGLSTRAKNFFEEIKPTIGDAQVICIGYSQGGTLNLELERLYQDQLNTILNIPINSPIGGAPVLSASLDDIDAFINANQEDLNKLGEPYKLDANAIREGMQMTKLLVSNLNTLKPLLKVPFLKAIASSQFPQYNLGKLGPNDIDDKGLTDMYPDSECSKNLTKYVREGNPKIPHVVIGTYASLDSLFDNPGSKKLNENYAKFIHGKRSTGDKVGKNSMKNDTMLPLQSQLARGKSFENINLDDIERNDYSIPVPKGCINTKAYLFDKTAHAGNLVPLHANLFIQKGKFVTSSRDVLDCVAAHVAQAIVDHGAYEMSSDVQKNTNSIDNDIDLD